MINWNPVFNFCVRLSEKNYEIFSTGTAGAPKSSNHELIVEFDFVVSYEYDWLSEVDVITSFLFLPPLDQTQVAHTSKVSCVNLVPVLLRPHPLLSVSDSRPISVLLCIRCALHIFNTVHTAKTANYMNGNTVYNTAVVNLESA